MNFWFTTWSSSSKNIRRWRSKIKEIGKKNLFNNHKFHIWTFFLIWFWRLHMQNLHNQNWKIIPIIWPNLFFQKNNKGKSCGIRLPQNKLKFNVKRHILKKKKILLNSKKLNEKTPLVTSSNNILIFGILCTLKIKKLGKRISHEIYKRHTVVGLQGFDNYKNLNPKSYLNTKGVIIKLSLKICYSVQIQRMILK